MALYNSTQENAQTFNETLNIDPLAVNTTPVDGAYTFSGLSFVVPSSQILIVVFNVSSSATGGGVFGAGITSAASVTTTSSSSGQSIIETLSGHVSGNSTLSALAVTGGTVAPSTISVGQSATGFLNLTFAATGETMNITSINITLTGNGTALNLSDVRIYRDEATAPGRFDSSDTFLSRGDFNGASVELNLTPNIYNVSIPIGTTIFFITYNVSAIALNGSTVSAQIIPSSSVSAVGNASGLAISVTGSSLASSNATIQSQARLAFSTITSSVTWLTNVTTGPNSTTIIAPVTNAGHATASLTSVVATLYNALTAENASTNFTITRADSVTTIAGGVTTTLNFTVNATTASQLNGLVNVSVTLAYNDSNTLVASANSPSETNTSGLFGLDGGLPTVQIVLPSNNAFKKGTQDINFTLNDTTSGVNNLSLSFQVNGTARTATCTPNQLNFTCTFSWATSNGTYTDGVYTLTVNVNDNATNSAIKSEVNVTVDNTAPALSGDNVTVSLINTTITTLFSVNITERNFNASNTFIGVRNLTNATVRNMEASCASLSSDVWRCNATWNGKDDSAANVVDGNYTFFANSTDNLSTYGTFNSTMVVTFTSDTGAPSITGSGPSGTITSTTPALLVNTSEPATCKFDNSSTTYSSMAYAMTGTSLTHNYTLWTLSDGTYTFYVRCQDAIGNAMTASETISFTKSTTAPVISSVANSTVTAYSAIINWTTDTSSSSIVEYGTNTSSMISSAEYDIVPRVTSHSVALNNLEKGTLYYYRVVSKDASGNRVNSTISNFTTADNITQWLGAGWNINFVLPSQTIMENRGYNASNTGNFNFTSILSSLGTNWNYMHYNINGTSAGWVLATRTDPGGSTLKYVNNTNDKYYSINITAPGGVRFVL
ncbi:MAG TPA: hypothetical protein HA230_04195 [Candidatus Aenigmarchaeota archaeon]|nr:hypothetical protein [Candidatus Aenigmarchaeota archaeon]